MYKKSLINPLLERSWNNVAGSNVNDGHCCFRWKTLSNDVTRRRKLSTLTFDLDVWPGGLKINRVLALDHSDPHIKFKRNPTTRSWVIVFTDGRTDGHDKVNTPWRVAFSYVIKLLLFKALWIKFVFSKPEMP